MVARRIIEGDCVDQLLVITLEILHLNIEIHKEKGLFFAQSSGWL